MGDNSYVFRNSYESSMLSVDNKVFVFPPINHEGLHIHSHNFPQSLHQFKPTASTSNIPNSRLNVTPCWNLWFKFMHWSIDSIHSRLLKYPVSRFISVLFSPVTVLLLVFWYSRVQRQRRALVKESHDRFIRIVAERDEEIGNLMRQIAQMNKLLCGIATSRST